MPLSCSKVQNLGEQKKTWESSLTYPSPQAFALPNPKDRQRKKPTSIRYYNQCHKRHRNNTTNVNVSVAVSLLGFGQICEV